MSFREWIKNIKSIGGNLAINEWDDLGKMKLKTKLPIPYYDCSKNMSQITTSIDFPNTVSSKHRNWQLGVKSRAEKRKLVCL